MNNTRYPKQSYVQLLHLDESGKRIRAIHIKDIIFTYGFCYVWILHDVGM